MAGAYKVPYPPSGRGGGYFKFDGEENQVVKRERKYFGFGEVYNVEKGKGEGNIICPIVLELLRKNIKWGRGERDGNFGQENQDIKNMVTGKNIKL